MKIWIHINGVQEGPYQPDNLPLNRMNPQTPVWYEGLNYWMPASTAPVTAEHLRAYYAGEAQTYDQQRQTYSSPEQTVEVEMPAEEETNVDTVAQAENRQPEPRQSGRTPYAGQGYGMKYGAYAGTQAQQNRAAGQPDKCPPTYLVWSILLTLLCCNPIGIVAAVTGWTVTSKYRAYDIEGARRWSETTAWWFIITIVTSLIFTPMYMLVSM